MSSLSFRENKLPKQPKPPEKPLMPYMRYSRKVWDKVKNSNPNLKLWEVGKIIGQMWRELPDEEKNTFVEEYEIEKNHYTEQLRLYHTSPAYQNWLAAKERAERFVEEENDRKAQHLKDPMGIPPDLRESYILEDNEEEADEQFSIKHVSAARFHRNHRLMQEILSDAKLPDFSSIITTSRLNMLKMQVEQLTNHKRILTQEIETCETKHVSKIRKISEDSEKFYDEYKKVVADWPSISDSQFNDMIIKAKVDLVREGEERRERQAAELEAHKKRQLLKEQREKEEKEKRREEQQQIATAAAAAAAQEKEAKETKADENRANQAKQVPQVQNQGNSNLPPQGNNSMSSCPNPPPPPMYHPQNSQMQGGQQIPPWHNSMPPQGGYSNPMGQLPPSSVTGYPGYPNPMNPNTPNRMPGMPMMPNPGQMNPPPNSVQGGPPPPHIQAHMQMYHNHPQNPGNQGWNQMQPSYPGHYPPGAYYPPGNHMSSYPSGPLPPSHPPSNQNNRMQAIPGMMPPSMNGPPVPPNQHPPTQGGPMPTHPQMPPHMYPPTYPNQQHQQGPLPPNQPPQQQNLWGPPMPQHHQQMPPQQHSMYPSNLPQNPYSAYPGNMQQNCLRMPPHMLNTMPQQPPQNMMGNSGINGNPNNGSRSVKSRLTPENPPQSQPN